MGTPRDMQFVRIKLNGEWEDARYYKSHIMCGDEPGYDLRNYRFIAAYHIEEWEDASGEDPCGHDISLGGTQ